MRATRACYMFGNAEKLAYISRSDLTQTSIKLAFETIVSILRGMGLLELYWT